MIENENKEYYEIRLESIGGLGANLCGKMLGELGLKYLDLNSSSFSSYGSEKTGTPVKGYVRYCRKEKEIRVHFPVVNPDLLVVFHEALIRDESVWKGCNENTAVVLAVDLNSKGNDNEEPCLDSTKISFLLEKLGSLENVFLVEAQRIAMETHSRINVVMLGAALKVMGVKDIEVGRQICTDTLGKKYPDALHSNLLGIQRGFEEVRHLPFQGEILSTTYKENYEDGHKDQEYWGYDTAPLGGVNPNFGSTVVSDVSPSRQGFIPLFIKEKCINCGLCHSTCPDMVFQFKEGEFKGKKMMINEGLDYYHCKGCLRCVDVCPVNALVRAKETEYPDKPYFMPNKDLLHKPKHYEKAGPDGYITSESYLTEKRMEGGEV